LYNNREGYVGQRQWQTDIDGTGHSAGSANSPSHARNRSYKEDN